jgi:hypothetical protein
MAKLPQTYPDGVSLGLTVQTSLLQAFLHLLFEWWLQAVGYSCQETHAGSTEVLQSSCKQCAILLQVLVGLGCSACFVVGIIWFWIVHGHKNSRATIDESAKACAGIDHNAATGDGQISKAAGQRTPLVKL